MNSNVPPNGLRIDRDGEVLTLTISRQSSANSLSKDLIKDLIMALSEANCDVACRVVVLTGEGDRNFCSGADLKSINVLSFDSNTNTAPFADLLRSVRSLEVPLVAKVNGNAAGGGVGLLGLCDFAIASADATFGISEIDVGFFPSMVVTALQRSLPRLELIRMCMLGVKLSAEEAVQVGLLSATVPHNELDGAVSTLIQQLLLKPPSSIRRGKYMLRAIEAMTFDQSLAFTETVLRAQAADPNASEGLAAFRGKRPPVWRGATESAAPTSQHL